MSRSIDSRIIVDHRPADALKMETTLNKYQQVSSIVQLTLQDEFGKKNRESWKIS